MTAIVEGPVLGLALGQLLNLVTETTKNAVEFKSDLNRLESTLKLITPIIKRIEELKKELDHPKEEWEDLEKQLKKGEELVLKCSEAKNWFKCYKRSNYAKKLRGLDDTIRRFLDTVMQAQQTREILQTLMTAMNIEAKVDWLVLGAHKGWVSNPIGQVLGSCGVPQPPAFTVGLDVPLKELKLWLFDDDDGTQVLVLSAPGGCGKTTLANKLCIDKEVKGKFGENIFFVTVSKTSNLEVIIKKLIEHKGYQARECQNDEDALNQLAELRKRIGTGPVLLVLDDVWDGLVPLVEKLVLQIPDYRILVTSRFEFPGFGSTYKLNLLDSENAMTLFCHSAFPEDGRCNNLDEDHVNKIVRSCKGFPLALTVVGSSLRGKPAADWRRRVMELSKGRSIFDSETHLLNCLQSSLDALDDLVIVKDCFMDLGLFPEDQRIPAAALIDMWAELYKLDEGGVYAISHLHKLSTQNLVNLVVTRKDASEVDGFYNEHFVTQHDLLRELAIYQSKQDPIEQRKRLIIDGSEDHPLKCCTELKQQPISARLLSCLKCCREQKHQLIGARLLSISSFSTDEMISSSWSDMKLPDVEVLVLNFGTENYTLPKFMKKMKKLKVLIVMNNGFCPAELSNFPLLGSLSNIKRIRLENISIPSLGNIKLMKLQKISFIMCRIGQAFRNCTIQLPHMLPNLVEINIDYCNDLVELPESLCDIVYLKKLSITNCHKFSELPEKIGNLANLEVLGLHACTELVGLPSSIGSLQKLSFLDLSDCLSMQRMPEQMGQLRNLQKLHMRGCLSLSELPPSIKDLKHLKYVFCDEETEHLWEYFRSDLPNLNIRVPEENINLNWLHNLRFE